MIPIPGTFKEMGFPKMVSRDPYYGTHIFRDSKMGVGLGNSMGPAYHKGVPLYLGVFLEFPLTFSSIFSSDFWRVMKNSDNQVIQPP